MKKKQRKYTLLLVLLLGITLGYAAIATTLKMTGIANVGKNTWKVYWTNPQVSEGSVNMNPPVISEDDNDPVDTKATWSANFDLPGDYYEFTIDAVNEGSIDAMIQDMTPLSTPELPSYIHYTAVYDDDDTPLEQYHMLPKAEGNTPTVVTIRVRIEYTEDITTAEFNNIPAGGINYEFSYGINYSQANENAIRRVPKQLCPGKKCIYAFYIGSVDEESDDIGSADYGYNIKLGTVLPLSFATASSHSATENYFGGPTNNYKDLKLEYDEYVTKYNQPKNSFTECDFPNNRPCTLFRRSSYQPKTFFGHVIDSNRVVKEKYACLDYNNNVYCFDTFKEYDSNIERGRAAYNVFVPAFGEWDETTKTGCKIYNPDSERYFSFDCKDNAGYEVEYHGTNGYDHVGLNIYTKDSDLDIYINLHDTYLSGPETMIYDD